MAEERSSREEAMLRRLAGFKTRRGVEHALGDAAVGFFKEVVQLVPAMLADHCCLESFHRGTLSVLVDSSSHLYELKQLLLMGLEKQLIAAARSAGLRKVTLKSGRWYDGAGADKQLRD